MRSLRFLMFISFTLGFVSLFIIGDQDLEMVKEPKASRYRGYKESTWFIPIPLILKEALESAS